MPYIPSESWCQVKRQELAALIADGLRLAKPGLTPYIEIIGDHVVIRYSDGQAVISIDLQPKP